MQARIVASFAPKSSCCVQSTSLHADAASKQLGAIVKALTDAKQGLTLALDTVVEKLRAVAKMQQQAAIVQGECKYQLGRVSLLPKVKTPSEVLESFPYAAIQGLGISLASLGQDSDFCSTTLP